MCSEMDHTRTEWIVLTRSKAIMIHLRDYITQHYVTQHYVTQHYVTQHHVTQHHDPPEGFCNPASAQPLLLLPPLPLSNEDLRCADKALFRRLPLAPWLEA